MTFTKKNMLIFSTLILVLFSLVLFGTLCYHVSNVTDAYYYGFDFGSLENLSIKSVLGTLVCVIGALGIANVVFAFLSSIDEKVVFITNVSSWGVALAFSITTLCSRFINKSYVPQNGLIYVLLICIVGIFLSIYLYVHEQEKE